MDQITYDRNPQTAGRIIDGLAYVITPDSQRMHTLNPTATVLWELSRAGFTAKDAARKLSNLFDVSSETALADLEPCLRDMVERRILVQR